MQPRVDPVDVVARDPSRRFLAISRRNTRERECVLSAVASEPPIRVSGAERGLSVPRIGSVDGANHWIGSTGAPSGDTMPGGALFCEFAPSCNAIPTGLSTNSPTVLSSSRREFRWNNRRLMYCCLVLLNSKEKRSMEPRQLRLPGFTRFWARELRAPDPPRPASAASTGPAADICCRSRN